MKVKVFLDLDLDCLFEIDQSKSLSDLKDIIDKLNENQYVDLLINKDFVTDLREIEKKKEEKDYFDNYSRKLASLIRSAETWQDKAVLEVSYQIMFYQWENSVISELENGHKVLMEIAERQMSHDQKCFLLKCCTQNEEYQGEVYIIRDNNVLYPAIFISWYSMTFFSRYRIKTRAFDCINSGITLPGLVHS